MRVTNSMLVSNYMNNLNNGLARLNKYQTQLATNRKFAHLSDDPVSLVYSQQARNKLTRLEYYQKNVDMAENWLTQSEMGVLEINELIKSAYESCVDAANDTDGKAGKESIADYLKQLRDQLASSLNTAFGEKYVFGGYNTVGYTSSGKTITPFTVENGTLHYNGLDLTDPANQAVIDNLKNDVLTFDIGPGIEMPVTINGLQIVSFNAAGDNLYTLFDDLYNTVAGAPGAEDISAYIPKLQEAQSHLLALASEIGGRTNRLEIVSSRYEQDELNYTQMKSDAEDVDQAEAIMNYKMAETVYNAALATGSFIIQKTLMDFLR